MHAMLIEHELACSVTNLVYNKFNLVFIVFSRSGAEQFSVMMANTMSSMEERYGKMMYCTCIAESFRWAIKFNSNYHKIIE